MHRAGLSASVWVPQRTGRRARTQACWAAATATCSDRLAQDREISAKISRSPVGTRVTDRRQRECVFETACRANTALKVWVRLRLRLGRARQAARLSRAAASGRAARRECSAPPHIAYRQPHRTPAHASAPRSFERKRTMLCTAFCAMRCRT
eukprot:1164654-Rhodomonas_salina.1